MKTFSPFLFLLFAAQAALAQTPLLDLHTHSICSDGAYAPEKVVAMAKEAGLSYYALADHDSVACVARAKAAAQKLGVGFIPAIEISVGDDRLHLLGLNINPSAHSITALTDRAASTRDARLEKILSALKKAGVPLDAKNDVLLPKLNAQLSAQGLPPLEPGQAAKLSAKEIRNRLLGQITRPDIARALVQKGYVPDTRTAFDKYIGDGGPGYVPMECPTFQEAITAIHKAGGIAVLAHPYTVYEKLPLKYSGKNHDSFDALLKDLFSAGVDGIEIYRPDSAAHPDDDALYLKLASETGKNDLVFTPGSDYHGPGITAVKTLYTQPLPEDRARTLLKKLGRPWPEAGCPFCAAQPPDTLAWEDENFFIKPSFGSLETEGYVLLIPKKHLPSYGDMSADEHAAFVRVRSAAAAAVSAAYGAPILFEHGVTGQTIRHAHLHIVPGIAFKTFLANAEALLKQQGAASARKTLLTPATELAEKARARKEAGGYLYLADGAAGQAVLFDLTPDPKHTMILRLAAAQALGRPELADWKKTQADPKLADEDAQIRAAAVLRLKPLLKP